jgi:hypothetical protein
MPVAAALWAASHVIISRSLRTAKRLQDLLPHELCYLDGPMSGEFYDETVIGDATVVAKPLEAVS